jgi:hypothetical protein
MNSIAAKPRVASFFPEIPGRPNGVPIAGKGDAKVAEPGLKARN